MKKMIKTRFRKGSHAENDYINYSGERVPVINRGYRVEMAHADLPATYLNIGPRFVLPVKSPEEAAKEARRLYPDHNIVSIRLDD